MTRKADLTEAQMRMIREHIDMFPLCQETPGRRRVPTRSTHQRIKKMIAPAGEADLAAQIRKFINLYGDSGGEGRHYHPIWHPSPSESAPQRPQSPSFNPLILTIYEHQSYSMTRGDISHGNVFMNLTMSRSSASTFTRTTTGTLFSTILRILRQRLRHGTPSR